MTLRRAISGSLALLTERDRRILSLVTLAQMSTAFLDLLGVFLLGIVTALSVSAVSGSPLPSLVQNLLDRVELRDPDPLRLALVLACIAGFVLVSKSIINMLLTRRILQFLANRQAIVSGRLTAGLLSRPLLQVQRRSSQETAYALTTGVNFATLVILGQTVVAVSELTLLVVLAVGLFLVSPVVTLFTILFFLIIALILQKLFAGWASQLGRRATDAEVSSLLTIQEALRTYREVFVANRRSSYVDRIQDLRWQAAGVQADLAFLNLVPKYVFEAALVVGAGLLAASQLLTRDLSAAIGVMVVFLAAGSRIVPSMLRLQGAALAVRSAAGQAAPSLELAQELNLSDAPAVGEPAQTRPVDVLSHEGTQANHTGFDPSIEVEGVWIQYPGSQLHALTDVSIHVPSGKSLALVGSTGSGKSTLADVVLGVLQPDRGTVRLGGVAPIDAVTGWPGALAYVPQEVAMTSGTVRQNVALGLRDGAIDDEAVWDALERAHLANVLREQREGLDTVIGEHGMKLSGGQRQRLGVARALYTRPLLLVLDEATSALDAETEREIALTLQDLEGSVTTVTVAHRLATIMHCDVVAYLEHGRIVASGSFEHVRAQVPQFDHQAHLLGL